MAKVYDVQWTMGVDDQTAEGMRTAYENLTKPLDRIRKDWNVFVKGIGVNAFVELAQKGLGALQKIDRSYADFFARRDRDLAFDNLAQRVGTNARFIVDELKKASGQIITTQAAVDAASRAFLLGLDPETIVQLMRVAASSTRVSGQTITQAFDDVTIGVARQSKQILDNLGIILDYDKHLKLVSRSTNKTTSELNDLERRQAFLNATLEAGEKNIQRVGSNVDELSERYKKAKTAIIDNAKEIKDAMLKAEAEFYVKSYEEFAFFIEKIAKPSASFLGESNKNFGRMQAMGMGDITAWRSFIDDAKKALRLTQEINKELRKEMPTRLSDLQFNFPPEFADIPQRLADDSGKYTDEYWQKWEERMAKAVDNYGKAILKSLDESHPLPKYVDDQDNMAKLIDGTLAAEELGRQQRRERDFGYQFGREFGEGFTYGAQRTISDGMYDLITQELDPKSALMNTMKMGGRLLADSMAEAFMEATGLKFSLTKFFTGLIVSAGGAAAGAGAGAATSGAGTGGTTIPTGGPVSYAAKGTPAVNNFNYYITDNPTLEKRINESVRKSLRENNLRQDVKGL